LPLDAVAVIYFTTIYCGHYLRAAFIKLWSSRYPNSFSQSLSEDLTKHAEFNIATPG